MVEFLTNSFPDVYLEFLTSESSGKPKEAAAFKEGIAINFRLINLLLDTLPVSVMSYISIVNIKCLLTLQPESFYTSR